MVPFKPPTPSNHWNKTRQKCFFFYQKIVFSAMWHFTFLPFLIFLFIYVELFHFWKTFKAYNTVLSDKNRNGILEYVSFCDKYFCLFYFSLVKQNQIWHCTGKKMREKMLHCLTHPSCNLYKINLWKKSVVRLPFFPSSPVFYISNFPPLLYPP